jgi:hypothetical protein
MKYLFHTSKGSLMCRKILLHGVSPYCILFYTEQRMLIFWRLVVKSMVLTLPLFSWSLYWISIRLSTKFKSYYSKTSLIRSDRDRKIGPNYVIPNYPILLLWTCL